ncbi:unnamed protein product [Dracunculus medinensis]|uniref:Splicing factor 45 n=1 Tax=Dracunculus medinensis TaxID=318479 RepID=A0A0N4UPZ9_DRAME|nr:unnamed protein product [Dracunculus medinensis]
MSLYDIFGEDPVEENSSKASDVKSAKGVSTGLRMLQSQIQAKKSQLAQSQYGDKNELSLINFFKRNVVTPVIDLSARNRSSTTSTILKPHKAIPIGDGFPLSFIPKSLKEDKVFLFGEILVEDEYNPTAPTDYAVHKQKADERKAKEKLAKEIAERLSREHQEEVAKRSAGAAIAPPQILMEEDSKIKPLSPPNVVNEMPPPSFIPSFGGAGKGLGVAANIMTKFGYKEGAGLGRTGQGMSTALKVERLGKNSGVIVNEHEQLLRGSDSPPQIADPAPIPAVNMAEALKQSTRILLLQNMVSADEIDDQLEPEVHDEMKKYGQVNKVVIFRILNARDDEAVRIFVEFTNVAQAIKAFVDLNGRFFGGRSIRASFYDLEAYNANHFDR